VNRYKIGIDDQYDIFILAILQGKNDILWLGTFGDGVIRYNLKTRKKSYITTNEGLINNNVLGLFLINNKLCVSTENGLSIIDTSKLSVKNYSEKDGLQAKGSSQNLIFKDKNNKIYLGGSNSFNSFYLDSIKGASVKPKLEITNFKFLIKKYHQIKQKMS